MSAASFSDITAALQELASGGVTRETVSLTESVIRATGLDRFTDVDDFLDMCASFRPGGGDYLYDESSIERSARLLLSAQVQRGDTASDG